MPSISGISSVRAMQASKPTFDFAHFSPSNIAMFRDGGTIKLSGNLNRSVSANVRMDGGINSPTRGKFFVSTQMFGGKPVAERPMTKHEMADLRYALKNFLASARLEQGTYQTYQNLLKGIDAAIGPAKTPGGKASAEKVAGDLEKAMKDIYYMSESDYPYSKLAAANPGNKPVTGAVVFDAFKKDLDKLFKDDVNEVTTKTMAYETWSAKDTKEFFTDGMASEDAAEAKAFKQLKKLVDANLTDVKIVKFGPKGDDGKLATDQGLYGIAIVGKTKDGQLAGLLTGSVET